MDRDAKLPQEYIPELRAAAEKANLDWDKFKLTDNRCNAPGIDEGVLPDAQAPAPM